MKKSGNIELYTKLFLHIIKMHENVEYRKILNGYMERGRNRKRYPACSVGAEYGRTLGIGDQHHFSTQTDFHRKVYDALITKLGELNEKETLANNGCQNRVGHCAENYAASNVLQVLDGCPDFPEDLCELFFTIAIQPRTWEIMDWCENCHTIYD